MIYYSDVNDFILAYQGVSIYSLFHLYQCDWFISMT